MTLTLLNRNKSFGGWHQQFTHESSRTNCVMRFAIYLPPQTNNGQQVPVLYWLSGLTCTDENFMQKAGVQRLASELGIAIVAPDTSPRGEGVATDPDGSYDLGLGAGFYVNATQEPWRQHYQMYDYVVNELPVIIENNFPVNHQRAISGHSMGGHGALVIGLRNPQLFSSISAFSPICNPSNCPWGQKIFSHYLGGDTTSWADYDATALIKKTDHLPPLLIDQGEQDNFLATQLHPDALARTATEKGFSLNLRMQEGYDHSYYFIASFIEDHLRFHAKYLFGSTSDQ